MYKRILVIGDIHGNLPKLKSLWNKINYNDTEDFLIFLGDYIDRGQNSLGCLRFVKKLTEENQNIHALMGNHESMMIKFFEEKNHPYFDMKNHPWLYPCNGGDKTFKQITELNQDKFNNILSWVKRLPVFYDEIKGYFFVHAGINPNFDFQHQDKDDMLWIREDCYDFYFNPEIKLVVGHTPVQYIKRDWEVPLSLKNNILLMDTGAAMGRKISCMDLISETLWQSN